MRVHHVGYLVSDMQKAIEELERFAGGGRLSDTVIFDRDRQIDIAFIQMGAYLLELVCPREGSTEVGKALRRLRNTPYHLCYECDDIEETIANLVNCGCMVVEEPKRAVAIEGNKVAFLFSDKIGLFEIVEIKAINEIRNGGSGI